MKITTISLLGNQSKRVKNIMEVGTIADINSLIRCCITDRETVIKRQDGKETIIICNGTVRDEVYNQRDLLLDWCTLKTDEFPQGGEYKGSSI